jgi:hypothetical protein
MTIVQAPAQTNGEPSAPPVPSAALPSGPLINKIGNMDAWKIDFTYAKKEKGGEQGSKQEVDSAATASSDPDENIFAVPNRRIIITYTKPIMHVQIEKTRGAAVHQWSNGEIQYLDLPKMGAFLYNRIPGKNSTEEYIDFRNGQFPDMEWISKETYVGMREAGGRNCLMFTSNEMTAWVDSETRYPLFWRRGNETRVFQRLEAPGSMLQLPSSITKIDEAVKKDIKRMNTPYRPRG